METKKKPKPAFWDDSHLILKSDFKLPDVHAMQLWTNNLVSHWAVISESFSQEWQHYITGIV